MNRRYQFGCGPHHLPSPWENYDLDVDLRKALPFPDGSAQYILAEHVIEHIPFDSGFRFLGDCMRLLEPGGVLRLCFPDVTRIGAEEVPVYRDFLSKYGKIVNCKEQIWFSILNDWGHVSCWTGASARCALESLGFEVRRQSYGVSLDRNLHAIDSHHLSVGLALAQAETTVLEAIR